jgi:hypothetical protein
MHAYTRAGGTAGRDGATSGASRLGAFCKATWQSNSLRIPRLAFWSRSTVPRVDASVCMHTRGRGPFRPSRSALSGLACRRCLTFPALSRRQFRKLRQPIGLAVQPVKRRRWGRQESREGSAVVLPTQRAVAVEQLLRRFHFMAERSAETGAGDHADSVGGVGAFIL